MKKFLQKLLDCFGSKPLQGWEPHWPLLGVSGMSPELLWLHPMAGKIFWGQDKNTSVKCQVPLMGVGGIKPSQLNGVSWFFFVVVPQKYKIQGKPCLVPKELGKYRPERVVVL